MNPDLSVDAFRLPAGAHPVACVDIGGTKVAVSVANAAGVHGRLTEPTVRTGDEGALAAQILRLIGQSCSSIGIGLADIAAVGVASCGPFTMRQGLIELAAPNICGGLAGPARHSFEQARQLNPNRHDAREELARLSSLGAGSRLRGWWRRLFNR